MELSPWHNLALKPHDVETDVYQGFIEIQRGTTAKMEVDTGIDFNPIVQDLKEDKATGVRRLRHYGRKTIFNYGMLP